MVRVRVLIVKVDVAYQEQNVKETRVRNQEEEFVNQREIILKLAKTILIEATDINKGIERASDLEQGERSY